MYWKSIFNLNLVRQMFGSSISPLNFVLCFLLEGEEDNIQSGHHQCQLVINWLLVIMKYCLNRNFSIGDVITQPASQSVNHFWFLRLQSTADPLYTCNLADNWSWGWGWKAGPTRRQCWKLLAFSCWRRQRQKDKDIGSDLVTEWHSRLFFTHWETLIMILKIFWWRLEREHEEVVDNLHQVSPCFSVVGTPHLQGSYYCRIEGSKEIRSLSSCTARSR